MYNDIIKKFFDTGTIKNDDNIIIALSGGMDSMCLLDIFYKLQSEFQFNLYAIHVHHGIRGIEANRDMNFVERYCKGIDIKIFINKVDSISYAKQKKISIEEAARILRYQEFKNIRDKFKKNNTYILVAHHMSDQAETIIHNMVRGTGIKGLVGMKPINGYILRPLLHVSKSEINKYVIENNIPYVEDSTNNDVSYKRNMIRAEVLPKIESLNDKAIEHIVELSNDAEEITNYIDSVSKFSYDNILINESASHIELDLLKFNSLNHIIKCNIVAIIFSKLVGTRKDITRIHIEDIINQANKNKGLHIDLPYNITFDKKGKSIYFIKNIYNQSMSRRKKI